MTEIGRISTAYVSAHDRTRVHDTRLGPRETRPLKAVFNGAIAKGLTIASVTWEMDVVCSVAMSDGSITDGGRSAEVMITACFVGWTVIRCQATLSNGQKMPQLFRVQVMDGPYFSDEATAAGPQKITVNA